MRLKRQRVPGWRICYPYISGGESSIRRFYVKNKKSQQNHWLCDKSQVLFLHTCRNCNAFWFGKGRGEAGEGKEEPCCRGLSWRGGSHPVPGWWSGPPVCACPLGDTGAWTTGPGELLLVAAGVEGTPQDTPSLAGHSGDIPTDEFKAAWTRKAFACAVKLLG